MTSVVEALRQEEALIRQEEASDFEGRNIRSTKTQTVRV